MNSLYVKTAVMCYFRFQKQCAHVSTEVGDFNADVLVYNGNKLIEIEVKTSKSDFNVDFGKAKHIYYAEAKNNIEQKKKKRKWVPNLFYFAVPELMEEWALHKLENHPSYGLLIVRDMQIDSSVFMSKKAKSLHDLSPCSVVIKKILLRMGSDLCNLYLKRELESQLLTTFLEQSKKTVEKEICDEGF